MSSVTKIAEMFGISDETVYQILVDTLILIKQIFSQKQFFEKFAQENLSKTAVLMQE